MQIHTDTLAVGDIIRATDGLPDVHVDVTQHGSRSRARKFDVTLSAVPRKGRRPRNSNRPAMFDAAATWDEWGVFLTRLFDTDPGMTVPRVYEDPEHFHWMTGARFSNGGPTEQDRHDQHRWEFQGHSPQKTYVVHECTCGAIHRHLVSVTWSEFRAFVS